LRRAKQENLVAHHSDHSAGPYFGALAPGDLLRILLISILSGFAIRSWVVGEKIRVSTPPPMFFGIIRIIVRAAPVGVRRDGLHHQPVRHQLAGQSRGADRRLLPHQHPVRAARARQHARFAGFSILRFLGYIRTSC
jgi:hypothetical protein